MRWWIPMLVLVASVDGAAATPDQRRGPEPRQAAAEAPAEPIQVERLGVSLDRIRKELEEPAATPILDELNRPRFRLTVQGEWLIGLPPWVAGDPGAVAPWVKPNMPLTQFEYLRMNTPEAFRAGVLYPAGPRLDPGGLWNGIRQSFRAGTAKKTRAQIEEELRRLDALGRKPPPQ